MSPNNHEGSPSKLSLEGYENLASKNEDFVTTNVLTEALCSENLATLQRLLNEIRRSKCFSEAFSENNHRSLALSCNYVKRMLARDCCLSFTPISFNQVMSFIFNQSINMPAGDLQYLLDFLFDARDTFEAMCCADKKKLQLDCTKCDAAHGVIKKDAALLISWTISETAKHIVENMFAPSGMDSSQFLFLLQTIASRPVTRNCIIQKRLLILCFQFIDKLLLDYITESSTERHSFHLSPEVEGLLRSNCIGFRSWMFECRLAYAKLGLIVDDYADCWRHLDQKITIDLAYKYSTSPAPANQRLPFSQTLASFSSKNWHQNLSLLATSAKQLGDLDLCYGLKSLLDHPNSLLSGFQLNSIISNVEGRYEDTLQTVLNLTKPSQHDLIELFDACIELGCLNDYAERLDQLDSGEWKNLYGFLIKSGDKSRHSSICADDLFKWQSTWTCPQDDRGPEKSFNSHLNFVIPNLLRVVTLPERPSPEHRSNVINSIERLIDQELILQSVFRPNSVDKKFEISNTLLKLVKNEQIDLDEEVQMHSRDHYWSHTMYRHLNQLGLIEAIRKTQPNVVDQILYKAAKFNSTRQNFTLTAKIIEDLIDKCQNPEIKLKSSLLSVEKRSTDLERFESLFKTAQQINLAQLDKCTKSKLILKILRHTLRLSTHSDVYQNRLYQISEDWSEVDLDPLQHPNISRWFGAINCVDDRAKLKTLFSFSESLNQQFSACSSEASGDLLNQIFYLDCQLLDALCQSSDQLRYNVLAYDCGTRLLQKIREFHPQLDSNCSSILSSKGFIQRTMFVWTHLRDTLLSLLTGVRKIALGVEWLVAINKIVDSVCHKQPELFVYYALIQLLELNDMSNDTSPINSGDEEEYAAVERSDNMPDNNLAFWRKILVCIQDSNNNDINWSDIILQTQNFLVEIRKVCSLPDIQVKSAMKTLRSKFKQIIAELDESHKTTTCSNQTSLRSRFLKLCEQERKSIRILMRLCHKQGTQTTYEESFEACFANSLADLQDELLKFEQLNVIPCKSEIESMMELARIIMIECDKFVDRLAANNSNNILYMPLINASLSKLSSQTNMILMPEHIENNNSNIFTKPVVFIHKIAQIIELIRSMSRPKKITFTGSDGIARPFMLKCEGDLGIDRNIMDLFGLINTQLTVNKSTHCKGYKLRRYAVTPLSSKAGLIQCLDAPSLATFYWQWVESYNGKRAIDDLYASTCEVLCGPAYSGQPRAVHASCQSPQCIRVTEPFYQVLWTHTKTLDHPLATEQPTRYNTIDFRSQFRDSGIYETVVDKLSQCMPQDLITNQLWFNSVNSYSYWLKTNAFISSCATASMVGYAIGLGDRHLGNILLDCQTGQVVHVDYECCFELGKQSLIPEEVPFRLTPNIIRAFGFAGLDGGFTRSCRDVLGALRSCRTAILSHLQTSGLASMTKSGVNPHVMHTRLSDATPIVEQVNDLLINAASLKNRAAMFEGWHPWI